MNKIEKLLRKASKKDRQRLLEVIMVLRSGVAIGLKVKKLAGSHFYRVRVGKYRVVFSMDMHNKTVVIEAIRLRNEGTYK